jgi:hypothetical protein
MGRVPVVVISTLMDCRMGLASVDHIWEISKETRNKVHPGHAASGGLHGFPMRPEVRFYMWDT